MKEIQSFSMPKAKLGVDAVDLKEVDSSDYLGQEMIMHYNPFARRKAAG